MHFVYSARYHADYGPHVFPIEKYRLVVDRLRQLGIPETAFVEPHPAKPEQLLRVHTKQYLADLQQCERTRRTQFSELPLTREIVDLFVLFCGGTIRAAESALEEGVAVHIGGGFHHAFADKAEGFCYLHLRVLIDIIPVVIVGELEMADRPVDGGQGQRQTQANQYVLPRLGGFSHLGETTGK